jgi:FkbM family methyltransferase
MLFSRWLYYLSSIPILFSGIKNWQLMLKVFLGYSVREPVVIELKNGLRFHIRTPMDIWVLKEASIDHQYERASAPIGDNWNIVDIGAGLGDFAVSVAKAHPHSTVYAYEPFPESYDLLLENVRLNQIANVKTFPQAIGAQTGSMQLHAVSAEAVQQSTVAPVTGGQAIQVQSIALDEVLAHLQLTRCDYLKMDCEGAEYDVFFNASPATLEKIDRICLEYHDGVTSHTHQDLVRLFELNGFEVDCTTNPAHSDLGLLFARQKQP